MPTQNKFARSIMERLEQEQVKEKQRLQKEKESPTTKKAETEPKVKEKSNKAEQAAALTTEKVEKKAAKPKKKATPTAVKEEQTPTSIEEEGNNQKTEAPLPDLSQFISPQAERVAKNKTFYLDQEVIDALHQAAKAQNMTDSRLCNEILRGVLGLS